MPRFLLSFFFEFLFGGIRKEMAENQAEFAKQRDLNKKSKMEQFQSQIKIRAKKIEKENKENRQLLQLQKVFSFKKQSFFIDFSLNFLQID